MSAADADQRRQIFRRLEQRNRVVAIMRIGLPVLGLLVLLGLLAQIVIASLLDEFGIANISIDRGNLVVDTPSYSSMTADGTMYTVGAEGARAAIANTDLIHLDGALLTVNKPSGSWMTARGETADMSLSSQRVHVPGAMEIEDSRGTQGTILGVHADLAGESMVSDGEAHIRYHNGTTLDAESMSYDTKTQIWTFNRVTLIVPDVPGAKPAETAAP